MFMPNTDSTLLKYRSGSDRKIRIRPKDPDPTKRPGSDQKTRIRPKDPDPTKRPGSDQKSRIHNPGASCGVITLWDQHKDAESPIKTLIKTLPTDPRSRTPAQQIKSIQPTLISDWTIKKVIFSYLSFRRIKEAGKKTVATAPKKNY